MNESKEINVAQVSKYLGHAFARATQQLGYNNTKGSVLYGYQVEFCYMLDDINRGPKYMVPKRIADVNSLINRIVDSKSEG